MVEASQQPGLVDEAPEACGEGIGVASGSHGNGQSASPSGEGRRHVLLYRDVALQGVIVRQVHKSETTFP
jgi:hypothetical protein